MRILKKFKTDQGRVFASIYTESSQGMLMIVWRGDLSAEKGVLSVLRYCFEQLTHKGLKYLISDISNLESEIEIGTLANIFDGSCPLSKSQLRKITFVSIPPNKKNQRKLEEMLVQQGVQVQTFPTYFKAVQWLLVPDLNERVWDESPELEF